MKLKLNALPGRVFFSGWNFDFLSALFLLGIVGGSLFGCFAVAPGTQIHLGEDVSAAASFAGTFGGVAFFLLLLCLASTSFLGLFFIPALVVVKAYCMSCSVAAFYAADGFNGLLCALFTVAVPSMLVLPAFFLCAQHAMLASGRLLSLRFHRCVYHETAVSFFKTVLFTAVSLLLFALYDQLLMPLALADLF